MEDKFPKQLRLAGKHMRVECAKLLRSDIWLVTCDEQLCGDEELSSSNGQYDFR